MSFGQVHMTCKWEMGINLSWGLSSTHAFYSQKTETIPLHLIMRFLMTSEATISVEWPEKK